MNEHAHHHHDHCAHGAAEDAVVRDPVCGMIVDPKAGKPSIEHGGDIYHFCSAGCRTKFEADPERYLGERPAPEPMPKGTQYTCPMHPEIVRDAPGACPICGMALEPMGVPTGDGGPNPELVDFTHRFWVSTVLALPLFVIAMICSKRCCGFTSIHLAASRRI